jgi:chromosome segregation ATPase
LRNVAELQAMLSVKSSESHGQTVGLREEIKEIQRKYRVAEERCEELTSAVPEATRPLLRQIQSLQSQMQERAAAFGETEASFKKRLRDGELSAARLHAENEQLDEAQHALELASAEWETKVKVLKDRLEGAEERVQAGLTRAEELTRQLRQRESQATAAEEQLQKALDKGDEAARKARSERDEGLREMTADLQAQTRQRENLEQSVQELHRKLEAAGEAAEGGNQPVYITKAVEEVRAPPTPAVDPYAQKAWSPLVMEDKAAMASTVEMLRSIARQKDGEIASLREQLRAASFAQNDLSEEMVRITQRLGAAQVTVQSAHSFKTQLKTLSLRHAAALQLIGEKDDELEDLTQDLQHVKDVFRNQTATLLGQIEALTGPKSLPQ